MINEEKKKVQLQAYNELRKNNFNGGIIMPTGSGKTYVMIRCLEYLPNDYTILYTCDNKKLRDQDFPAELEKWGASYTLERMDRMCYKSAYKLEGKHYNILLMDEGDFALTPEYIKLLANNTFDHIIFASATLEKEKRAIIEQYVPIVYEKEVREIEDRQIINKADMFLVNFMLTKTENNKYLGYNEAFRRYLDDPKKNAWRIEQIIRARKLFLSGLESARKACQKLAGSLYAEEGTKILIFCSLSDQADAVCKYSYHTKNQKDNPYLEMFDKGKLRIISVVGKIDRGVNLDGVNCVIFESPAQSRTKMTQKSGRARRLHIDDISRFYFLVPFYRDRRGQVQPTIVQKWVLGSTRDFNQNFKTISI